MVPHALVAPDPVVWVVSAGTMVHVLPPVKFSVVAPVVQALSVYVVNVPPQPRPHPHAEQERLSCTDW